jgi:hypothetical protein
MYQTREQRRATLRTEFLRLMPVHARASWSRLRQLASRPDPDVVLRDFLRGRSIAGTSTRARCQHGS